MLMINKPRRCGRAKWLQRGNRDLKYCSLLKASKLLIKLSHRHLWSMLMIKSLKFKNRCWYKIKQMLKRRRRSSQQSRNKLSKTLTKKMRAFNQLNKFKKQ